MSQRLPTLEVSCGKPGCELIRQQLHAAREEKASLQAKLEEIRKVWLAEVAQLTGETGALRAENERGRELLRTLAEKLRTVAADSLYVWTVAHAHGVVYRGPTYTAELEAAEAFLAPPEVKSEPAPPQHCCGVSGFRSDLDGPCPGCYPPAPTEEKR